MCVQTSRIEMAKRLTTEEFIKNARSVHGTKFDYSKTNYINKRTPVTVSCPIHGEYEIAPHNHIRSDCNQCFLDKKSKGSSKTTEQFISEAISVHGNKYDYSSTLYINKRTKVSIICKVHGEFEQAPSNHLLSSGCRQCSRIDTGKKRLGKKNNRRVTNTEEFILESKKIHGDYFDYTSTVYKSAKDAVYIKCPKHGEFSQTAHNHLTGFKCNLCAKENISDRFSLGTKSFIEQASRIHKGKYNYSKTKYVNANDKIIITCPDHGDIETYPTHHLNGSDCKHCALEAKTTSLEEFINSSTLLHNSRYDYSLVNYINNNTPVAIICPEHGIFEQRPRLHACSTACGCPICNKISFWDISRFSPEQLAELNGIYIMILEEKITGNQLVKVGISKNVKKRCQDIERESNNFYFVRPLAYHPKTLSESIKIEVDTHRKLACYSASPEVSFAGETECFSIDSLAVLVELGLLDIEQLERLNEGYELLGITPL